jgi:hypothetical protein
MPTPGERRALIFIAALGALGVAARGWKELRGPTGPAAITSGDRAGLARQIEAVDSAIAAGGAHRRGRAPAATNTAIPRSSGKSRMETTSPEPPARPQMPPEWPPRARYPANWLTAPTPPATDPHEAYRRHWERADSVRRVINGRGGFNPGRRLGIQPQGATPRVPAEVGRLRTDRPPVDLDTAPADEIAGVTAIGPALARRIVADRIERGPFGSIDGLTRVRGMSRPLARRLQPYVTFSLASRLDSVPDASAPVRTRRRPAP